MIQDGVTNDFRKISQTYKNYKMRLLISTVYYLGKVYTL